jgi:hypothetical protein
MIRKHLIAEIKSARPDEPVGVVCSTGSVDREGDTISADGWALANYARNPVVLWGHDRSALTGPIGMIEGRERGRG